jgi:hypothetical protein
MEKFGHLQFDLDNDWNAIEFSDFLNSLASIYNVFLAINIKNKLINHKIAYIEKELGKNKNSDEDDFNKILKLLKLYLNDCEENLSSHFPLIFFKYNMDKYLPSVSTSEIFLNINSYSSNNELLQIHSININSPGLIDFTGIADIIREIRELIKDLWYRNKQEKTVGELNIEKLRVETISERLKMVNQFPDDILVKRLNKESKTLETFKNEKKLNLHKSNKDK